MPYVSRSTANRRGSYKYTQKKRRKGTSIVAMAKRRKSAAAQSRQIQRVARLAVKNAQILKATRVYTDYYLAGESGEGWVSKSWQVFSLMDPTLWRSTMRENTSAQYTQTAYIPSMYVQYVCALNTLKASAAMTMFLVSIRKDYTHFIPTAANVVDTEQFQSLSPLCAPVLNTGIFNIRWQKTFMLMSNNLSRTSAPTDAIAGDPLTTYVRGAVNLKVKTNLRCPSIFSPPAVIPDYWQTLEDKNLPAHQRLYLMVYFSSEDQLNSPGMFWSLKTTAVTSN